MKVYILIPLLLILFSCSEKKGPFDFEKVKTDLNLNTNQIASYDEIIDKYSAKRKAVMTSSGERNIKLDMMRGIMKNQIHDTYEILDEGQKILFEPIAERFTKFGNPGYSEKFLSKLETELTMDSIQKEKVRLVNKAFGKAYIEAHDYYHGKPDIAKEYWNKFDSERRKAIASILSKEQYDKYLLLAKDEVFKGEH